MAVPFSVIAKKLKMEGPKLRRELKKLDIESLDSKADFFQKEMAQKIIQNLLPKEKTIKPVESEEDEDKNLKEKTDKKDQIELPVTIAVKDLAGKLQLPVTDLLKKLLQEGISANLNQSLDYDTASVIASDLGKETIQADEEAGQIVDNDEEGELRPPVVVVMGHVDHGKTSLLDYIRKTKVMSGESGGITQHIGAYQAEVKSDNQMRKITFIDTPGHEAFSRLRSLGAKVTDLAILVVAADDSVKPQTREAIDHAKLSGVPIIVAINKIDKPGADIEKVKKDLAEIGLMPEEWGGTTPMAPISSKTGEGIDELLEVVLLTADLSDIKARETGLGEGIIVEANVVAGQGPVSTVINKKGKFEKGDYVVAGGAWGRIKGLKNHLGEDKKEILPSEPAVILGFKKLPIPGQKVQAVENEKEAKNLAEKWDREEREKNFAQSLFSTMKNQKVLPIVVKADAQGSLESLNASLEKLSSSELKIKIIHSGVGNISESDIYLALSASALVVGFKVKPDLAAKKLAEQRKIKIFTYDVIYDLLGEVEKIAKGLSEPKIVEKELGRGTVLKIFKDGENKIIGIKLVDGVFKVGDKIKIKREKVIGKGEITSLKVYAKAVEKVDKKGEEFGAGFTSKTTLKEKDILIAYKIEEELL
ncbi:MAG: translation initiation factor IF-2 [Patescibacteria group bacterium]|nr:translation initiation factor IF-2 [Patescibacteria group bacterium]